MPLLESPFYSGPNIKRAAISGATSGDNTLVSAVTGKKIRVLALFLTVADAVTIRFESGAGGTALTGVMTVDHDPATGVTSNPFVLPLNLAGWFETAAGSLLNMELSGAIQVSGALLYQEI